MEKAESYIKNSKHFIQLLRNPKLDKNDIIASFEVKFLYPSIPVDKALQQIAETENFSTHILDLSKHCLKNAYFMFDNHIYKQTEGAAMGFSLSPVTTNLFMTYFENKALNNANQKPKLWLRYVYDIFVVWPHGKDVLQAFLKYINSIHSRIQFTLELEQNNKLPFLDVLITKTRDDTLQYTVYKKPTHTNRYLNAESDHHRTEN